MDYGSDYQKVAETNTPITLEKLDVEIRKILRDHVIAADYTHDMTIQVEHAY